MGDISNSVKERYITIHSNSIKSTPIIRFSIKENESIQQKAKAMLLESCTNEKERNILANNKLHFRYHDNVLSKESDVTLQHLNIPDHHNISLLAETDHENFNEHFHILRFLTPSEKEVKLFQNWLAEETNKGTYLDVWHDAAPGLFGDVRVHKEVHPVDIELKTLSFSDPQNVLVRNNLERRLDADSFHENFHGYEEIVAFLNERAQNINEIKEMHCELFNIGSTAMNNNIYAVKLWRDDPEFPPQNRPKFLDVGGVHAREWVGTSTLLYKLDCFANPDDTVLEYFARRSVVYIIPLVNVDGYEHSRGGDRFWRKNCQNHFPTKYNFSGVDINRNFPTNFLSVGASKNPEKENYAGPYASSELETRALEKFIENEGPFLGIIDWHSYSRKFSFPYCDKKEKNPHYDLMMDCAEAVTKAINMANGTQYSYGQVSLEIYRCSGTLLEFTMKNSLFCFVNELDGDESLVNPLKGFLVSPEKIKKIGMENLLGSKAFMDYTLKHHYGEHAMC